MLNEEHTGVVYVGTDGSIATYALFMLGEKVMYITVDQASTDFEMWCRAPGKFDWVKTGMICARAPHDPTRAWGLSIAEFVLRAMPFLLVAIHDPAFAAKWTTKLKTKNDGFIRDGIADAEAFLAQWAKNHPES